MISKAWMGGKDLTQTIASEQKRIVNLVGGKNIIMLVGYTGVGKSTLIHGLIGNQLICSGRGKVTTKQNGPKIGDNNLISQTSQISLWETKKGLVICDTAGFGDTRGYQTDIVNCLSISAVVKYARSLKVVLVISQNSFTQPKYISLKKIVKQLSKSVETPTRKNFILCVTKCFENQQQIRKHFVTILDHDKELTDKEVSMLNFLAKESKVLIFKYAKSPGEVYQISEKDTSQILQMDCFKKSQFYEEKFTFISEASKIQIYGLIDILNQEKVKFNKDKALTQKKLMDMQKILSKVYSGSMSGEDALKKIEIESIKDTWWTYFLSIFKIDNQVKRKNKKKATDELQSIISASKKIIEGCDQKIKKVDNTKANLEKYLHI